MLSLLYFLLFSILIETTNILTDMSWISEIQCLLEDFSSKYHTLNTPLLTLYGADVGVNMII